MDDFGSPGFTGGKRLANRVVTQTNGAGNGNPTAKQEHVHIRTDLVLQTKTGGTYTTAAIRSQRKFPEWMRREFHSQWGNVHLFILLGHNPFFCHSLVIGRVTEACVRASRKEDHWAAANTIAPGGYWRSLDVPGQHQVLGGLEATTRQKLDEVEFLPLHFGTYRLYPQGA